MSTQQKGTLWMIPVPLAEQAIQTLSVEVAPVCRTIKHFFVENLREARRFLKLMDRSIDIDQLEFSEMNRNTALDLGLLRSWLEGGHDVGVLSDAGCPGIADPGADLAALAQKIGAKVRPLTGPSSILLALMASGLNGQSFSFVGYLPVKEPDRSKKIKQLEMQAQKENQTQIFIETPYRNDVLLQDLLKNCAGTTKLCIGINITGDNELIQTKTITDWQKNPIKIGKHPTIYLIL